MAEPPGSGKGSSVARRTVPLTPRQRDILRLLCAGKVNKEIARELDIGLGTVKQHIVALFKRLQVRNRSMAVSQGLALLESATPSAEPGPPSRTLGSDWAGDSILMRRSCIVLSLALPVGAPAEATPWLHRTLAGLACDASALFIPRDNGGGDLLFGVRRSSERDLLAALQLAAFLQQEIAAGSAAFCQGLRGGLNAGMAIVSKERGGGWSGEAVATPVIAATRRLLHDLEDGYMRLGPAAREAWRVFGRSVAPETLAMNQLADLFRLDGRQDHRLVGRGREWGRIQTALEHRDQGVLLRLEGDTGMGKSGLCCAALAHCASLGGRSRGFHALPVAAFAPLCDAATGAFITTEDAAQALSSPRSAIPDLVVIDDFHLLPPAVRSRLAAAGQQGTAQGRVVLLAGRRTGLTEGVTMVLRRLSAEGIRTLLAGVVADEDQIRRIVEQAAGVPWFALELARSATGEPTLPLLMTIAARLDGCNLDWKLLQTLAQGPELMPFDALRQALEEPGDQVNHSIAAAVRAGVLMEAGSGPEIGFRHPLVRQIVALLQI